MFAAVFEPEYVYTYTVVPLWGFVRALFGFIYLIQVVIICSGVILQVPDSKFDARCVCFLL
jgi:hypothetical protein